MQLRASQFCSDRLNPQLPLAGLVATHPDRGSYPLDVTQGLFC
jgi:hypothetical protein